MTMSGPGAHRYVPTSRTHRPVQRGRHRLMDRQRTGAHHLRVASATLALLLSLTGHFLGRPRTSRRSARRA